MTLVEPKKREKYVVALTYPCEEEGGSLLVQIISTCLRGAEKKGGDWESAPCGGDAAQILPSMTERTLERGKPVWHL
jgi:hypothetical protein